MRCAVKNKNIWYEKTLSDYDPEDDGRKEALTHGSGLRITKLNHKVMGDNKK